MENINRRQFLTTSLILSSIPLLKAQIVNSTDTETVAIAKEAYIYGLPLVLTDLTRIVGSRPSNQFHHSRAFPDHTFKAVVRPNNDTFYSSAFLDLGTEPIILEIPDTKDRYAVVPLMDAWTNVFASFGKRTTGTKAQRYIITGPKWKGVLPKGIEEVKSPTDVVWIISRIQVNSPEDGKNFVSKIQDGLKLRPLSQLDKNEVTAFPKITYSVESSEAIQVLKAKRNVVEALKKLTTEEYFTYLNELLVKNPALEADKKVIDRFAKIGIKAGQKFSLNTFDQTTQTALQNLPIEVINTLEKARTILTNNNENKPDVTIGHYGTNYQKRAAVAYFGLGALGPEDAVYQGYREDTDHKPLNGENQYVIHFEPNKTPPAKAFWSITLYDKAGYLTENAIRRYAIGDRSNLKYNADGSLDIYIQHDSPGTDKENNWLPAPKEDFNLSVRIYWATDEYLKTGNWVKPAIRKIVL
ncbi:MULTISPECIES: DUF1254 domain-containing protein [unclassified Arcicella]|uniref:DUF1254 domain-containing protein n=1 Tax=unclassified Arcicella TaxID=2644986 RepID=UPI0028591CF4|nr:MULTISPECIES: DUF1254 domain-containing protein [unclassified Arcicella]MDR6562058.1 hypothetical protein [Arcicella sp. BE51]MDR6811930.1 hypothetical protein [Arcicella sp. BE140]MDR6822960.1 hypothetical protein [Arcicella sp. BE139]